MIASPSDPMTEERIHTLVHAFYGRIREDPELAPIFETRLKDRWDVHLPRMCDFWSTVLLGTRRFHGNPMAAHMGLPGLTSAHFDRWMELFEKVAFATLPDHLALDVTGRAARVRVALERSALSDFRRP